METRRSNNERLPIEVIPGITIEFDHQRLTYYILDQIENDAEKLLEKTIEPMRASADIALHHLMAEDDAAKKDFAERLADHFITSVGMNFHNTIQAIIPIALIAQDPEARRRFISMGGDVPPDLLKRYS